MGLPSEKTTLELPLTIENDLEVDDNGTFYVVTYLFPDDSDDSVEIRIQFDHIIDNLIDFYREEYSTASSYGQLYLIANELNRHQDNLRSVAEHIEGKHLSEDLFGDYDNENTV
tara:strand:- start:96 stop:437 length:342 start_codon:yes stop_codon:yes gene_type:complete